MPEQKQILPPVVRRVLLETEIPLRHATRSKKAAVLFLRNRRVDAHLDRDVARNRHAHVLRQQLRSASERNRGAGIDEPEHRILGHDRISAKRAERRICRLHRRSGAEIASDDRTPVAGNELLRSEHPGGDFDLAVPDVAVHAVGDFHALDLPFARRKAVSGIVLPRISAPGRIDHQLKLAKAGKFGVAGGCWRIEPEFERIGVENRIVGADRLEGAAGSRRRSHGEAQSLLVPSDGALGLAGIDNRLFIRDVGAAPVGRAGERHCAGIFAGGDYAVRFRRPTGFGDRINIGALRRKRQKYRQNAEQQTHHIS